jgi:hypothetical protein
LRDEELAAVRTRLEVAEHELEDLRAIRDALTPARVASAPRLGAGRRLPARRGRAGQRRLLSRRRRAGVNPAGHRRCRRARLAGRETRGVGADDVRCDRALF